MELEYSLTPCSKINSKWIKDLYVSPDTTKLIGRALFDINHSKIFCDPPPRVMKIKTKQNKKEMRPNFKSFCTAKENINKMKR